MSRKSRFRRSFDKQHGKRFKSLSKSAPEHFYHIYGSMWRQLSWKQLFWVIWKILGLFFNTLTAGDNCSLLNRDNFNAINSDAIIEETKKCFWSFLCIFWIQIKVRTFWKRWWPSQPIYYGNYRLRKTSLEKMCKKSRFRRPFDKRHCKRTQTLFNYEGQHFYHT